MKRVHVTFRRQYVCFICDKEAYVPTENKDLVLSPRQITSAGNSAKKVIELEGGEKCSLEWVAVKAPSFLSKLGLGGRRRSPKDVVWVDRREGVYGVLPFSITADKKSSKGGMLDAANATLEYDDPVTAERSILSRIKPLEYAADGVLLCDHVIEKPE